MYKVVGYVIIKKDATTHLGATSASEFTGKACRVLEFAQDGGVLVINPEATALAAFESQDIQAKFRCEIVDGVIVPPDLNVLQQMVYVEKAICRKGGYNEIVTKMVIAASLAKGRFCDSFLWDKQYK
jgi:hypothetical protein